MSFFFNVVDVRIQTVLYSTFGCYCVHLCINYLCALQTVDVLWNLFEAVVLLCCIVLIFLGERFSNPKTPYSGEPCAWTWEELERRDVKPPFKPHLVSAACSAMYSHNFIHGSTNFCEFVILPWSYFFRLPQASPTDLRHFDPTLTSIPPTIADLVGTERSLHIEGFDYIAPATVGSNSSAKLDSTIVESHRSVTQQGQEQSANFSNMDNTIEESHEQHRPISKQVHNGKGPVGNTLVVTAEINES